MGSIESKPTATEDCKEINSYNSNSLTSRQIESGMELDPRSPSVDIVRTPIEVMRTQSQLNSPPVTLSDLREIINIDDPRSPTTEFNRTPIAITSTETENQPITFLHNKILDKARIPHLVPTPIKIKRGTRFAKMPEARKLIESNTVLKFPENKRNSFVGLLETNIDFVETDLDAVIQNKSIKEETNVNAPSVNTEETNKGECDISSVGVSEEESLMEEVPDKTKNCELNESVPTRDDLISIESLNRKLSSLIFEEKMQMHGSPMKSNYNIKHRIPLHDQNPNSQLYKSIPVLRVSDKPTKLIKSGSKIPVFKDRSAKGKLNIQCENTPPRIKAKAAEWAAEDSMII